jgi:DNA polymerase-1
MFLPGLPAWLHGLIKPPPDMALFELDFRAEEIGLMAGLSGDPTMIEDFRAGPYLRFAVRAGLAPADATEKTHPEIYALCKIICLGMNYGMSPYGTAAKTGKSLAWAREIYARHRLAYPVFHRWLDSIVAQARFDEVITSPFQWPQIVTATSSTRSLMNFPAQAGGSDILRIAAITATECGYTIAAPVHDSLWVLTPLAELDDTVAAMSAIMAKAGALVTGGLPIDAKLEYVVRSPQCLGDVRGPKDKGQILWSEVKALVHQFQQEKTYAQAQAAAGPAA